LLRYTNALKMAHHILAGIQMHKRLKLFRLRNLEEMLREAIFRYVYSSRNLEEALNLQEAIFRFRILKKDSNF